ncbi:MAG: Crp/Fnr family transcriptional regulator [Solirubrobacterales bacterium]
MTSENRSPDCAHGKIQGMSKGTWLYRAGEPATEAFVILSGAVVLRKFNIGGDHLAVDLVTKGGSLGYRAYVGNRVQSLSAQCTVDCVVRRIPFDELDAAIASDRTLEKAFLQQMASDLGAAQERMMHVTTLKVRDRLLILLGRLARDFTTLNDQQTLVVAPPISRIDMAALAGMTPESLSRCIRSIETEGLAHFSRRHVVIPSIADFRAELSKIGAADEIPTFQRLAG